MFSNPLGLLALVGVPLVVALHMYRRRHEPRLVSALFLWEAVSDAPTAGRRRERLLRSPSFWSELFAALLLGLAFAGPRSCADVRARHLVAVLDGSASMSAAQDGTSARDEALRELERELRALPGGSRATVIESGARPRVLAGPGAFPDEARARLADWRPSAGSHDAGAAIALALELAGDGSALYFTDRFEPDALPPEVGLRAFGAPLDNLALARARRVREDGAERVLAAVASFATRPARATLRLESGGALLAERALELAPGETARLELELPPETGDVRLALSPDALPLDGEALLLPPPRRTLRLASELDLETAVRLNLASLREGASSIERWLAMVPDSVEAVSAEQADLALVRAPVGSSSTWCLVLEEATGERDDLVGPFVIERAHPLLAGLSLEGVIWSAPRALRLEGTPLVSAGDAPLLTEQRDGRRVLVRARLDPFRSTLQHAPDWPILLANLAELRRDALPGPQRVDLAPGEPLVYTLEVPGELTLRGPDGERRLAARERLVVDDLETPGLYVLEQEGRELARYALAFQDAAESDLRARSSGRREVQVEAAELQAGSSWLVRLASLGALALLLLDVAFLRPRAPRSGGRP